MPEFDYDMLVIGSGPAGHRAAIQATKLGKHVALVERKAVVGGVCVNTGTIPSKTLREAVMRLSGYRDREVYGASYTVKDHITMEDLLFRADHVIRHEADVMRHQLVRNDVEVIAAEASFVDQNTIRLGFVGRAGWRDVTTDKVVVAVGTSVTRDEHIPFDGTHIFTSDDVLTLDRLPRTLAVIGGGVVGIEYASMLATLGVRVTIIDKRPRLLDFMDHEIVDALVYHMRQDRCSFRLGEEVSNIERFEDPTFGERVRIHLASGKQINAEKALYSIGRTGSTARLDLPVAGLSSDERGRIKVDDDYCTDVPNIYAVGDVIGFPSLASTSMEQGRLAACHAFGEACTSIPALFPYGVYAIPEMAMVGRTEEELTNDHVPYEVGKAQYREIARGEILGDTTGLLKLLFHIETRKLLGVHIIGEGASELIHIGQAVLSFDGTVDYFVDTVFNYPTLAECYKTAAFNGINRLH
ncbi:MAG: Si-specific NAD(P)(+) transhydrogenase [Candidatus Poribacteria bacterium]